MNFSPGSPPASPLQQRCLLSAELDDGHHQTHHRYGSQDHGVPVLCDEEAERCEGFVGQEEPSEGEQRSKRVDLEEQQFTRRQLQSDNPSPFNTSCHFVTGVNVHWVIVRQIAQGHAQVLSED